MKFMLELQSVRARKSKIGMVHALFRHANNRRKIGVATLR
jgi:hypothetical protein